MDIDSTSSITIYSLSTVGSIFQLSVDEVGIINQSGNVNGLASTATLWSRAASLELQENNQVPMIHKMFWAVPRLEFYLYRYLVFVLELLSVYMRTRQQTIATRSRKHVDLYGLRMAQ